MGADLFQNVIAKLAASKSPLGYTALKNALVGKKAGVSEGMLADTLKAAVNSQQIFFWGTYGRSRQCYWNKSRDAYFDEVIVKLCSARALPRSEVKAPGLPAKAAAVRITELVRGGRLKKFPKIGSEKERIGVSAESYAAALREFVIAKLNKAGIAEEMFFGDGAAGVESASGMEDRIVAALRKLGPEPDVPVASILLRRELAIDNSNKAEFDQALLRLRDRKRVYLSRHHNPHALPADERAVLIDGGDGSYYVAANLRTDT